jgi:hypothetical protein
MAIMAAGKEKSRKKVERKNRRRKSKKRVEKKDRKGKSKKRIEKKNRKGRSKRKIEEEGRRKGSKKRVEEEDRKRESKKRIEEENRRRGSKDGFQKIYFFEFLYRTPGPFFPITFKIAQPIIYSFYCDDSIFKRCYHLLIYPPFLLWVNLRGKNGNALFIILNSPNCFRVDGSR